MAQEPARQDLGYAEPACAEPTRQEQEPVCQEAVKVAAVDLGTVTSRLLLATVRNGAITSSEKTSYITDLGQGVDATGELAPQAVDRVVAACEDFAARIAAFKPQATGLTLTSAARDAHHGAMLLERLRALGFNPQIIPGEVEARLTFFGVAADFPGERIAVADPGGGSTEIAFGSCAGGTLALDRAQSLNIGCRRVTEKFLAHTPPTPAEIAAADAWIAPQFSAYWDAARTGFPEDEKNPATAAAQAAGPQAAPAALPDRLVAVGGTVTTMVAMLHELDPYDSAFVHLHDLSLPEVETCVERLSALTTAEIAALPGIQAKRAPVMLGGALVIRQLLATGGYGKLTVSENGLLVGLARTVAEAYVSGATTVGWLPALS